jgi:hypothetical protein
MPNSIDVTIKEIIEGLGNIKKVSDELNGVSASSEAASTSTNKLTESTSKGNEENQGLSKTLDEQVGKYFAVGAALEITQRTIEKTIEAWHAEVDAAAEDEAAFSRLQATIESTGRAGEISVTQIVDLKGSLHGLFDDAEIAQASNTLLRFMDIPSSQIPGDMKLIENMAAGLGISLPEAAQTFGQAMETGRTRGMGFSRELTNQINLLMAAGQIQQADAIILDQLTQKYSGQAAASLGTYAGKQQALKTATDELNATVGSIWLPLVKKVDDVVIGATKSYTRWAEILWHIKPAVNDVDAGVADLATTTTEYDTELVKHNQSIDSTKHILDAMSASYQKALQAEVALGVDSTLVNAFKKAQPDIEKYNVDLEYYTNLNKNGPAILEGMRDKLDVVAAQYGVNSEQYNKAKGALKLTEDAYKNSGGAIDYYKGKLDEENAAIEKTIAETIYKQTVQSLDAKGQLELARSLGLLSEQDYAVATSLADLKSQYDTNADGVVNAAEKQDDYLTKLKLTNDAIAYAREHNIPVTQEYINTYVNNHYDNYYTNGNASTGTGTGGPNPNQTGGPTIHTTPKPGTGIWTDSHPPKWIEPVYKYAQGGDIIVPPGYENDNYPIFAQSGERVIIIPAGESSKGGQSAPIQSGGGGKMLTNNGTINLTLAGDDMTVAKFMQELGVAMG